MHGAEDHAVEVEAEVEEEGDVGVAMARDVAELDVALGVDGNGVAVVGIAGLTHKTQSVAHGELVMNGEVESRRVEVSGNVGAEEADASGHDTNVRGRATLYVAVGKVGEPIGCHEAFAFDLDLAALSKGIGNGELGMGGE